VKTAVVCGAGGFLGNALVKRLKSEGYYVRGISRSDPKFERSQADEFIKTDLRFTKLNDAAFRDTDEVYQCAGNTGGIGYLENRNNAFYLMDDNININKSVLDACANHNVKRLLFVSTGCVYPVDLSDRSHSIFVSEADAYPARCGNAFGWASLFVERLYVSANDCGHQDTRIVRLHSTYGPGSTWRGGTERAPAALCRKVAEAKDGGTVEVIGGGHQVRSFMYIDDAIEGIRRVMASDCGDPINVGSSEPHEISQLVRLIAEAAGKSIRTKSVPGAIGAVARASDNALLKHITGWEPSISIVEGIYRFYPWVAEQVEHARVALTAGGM
jgi:nucleoside-diphosphate-sugar epimerase